MLFTLLHLSPSNLTKCVIVDMMLEELEILRKTLAQKKKKAKTSSSTSKRVRFDCPKVREVTFEPAPTMTKVTSRTTIVPLLFVPIPQLPPPSDPTEAILRGTFDSEPPWGGVPGSTLPQDW